jgi:hypothetical protein
MQKVGKEVKKPNVAHYAQEMNWRKPFREFDQSKTIFLTNKEKDYGK